MEDTIVESLKLGLKYTWIEWLLAIIGIIVIVFFLVNIFINKSDVSLAWRNVLRNKRRSTITLLAVIFAFTGNILLGSYFLSMFYGLRESTIRSQTGHLQILKKGFVKFGTSSPGEYLIEDSDEIIAEINKGDQLHNVVDLYMKEVRFNGIISSASGDRSLNFIGRGVDVEQDKILAVFDSYVEGVALKEDKPFDIILGKGLAEQLKVKSGESVTLLSSLFDGGINVLDGTVGGIIQMFSKEYSNVVVKTSLSYAQDMVGSDGVNKIIFLLHDTSDTLLAKQHIQKIITNHPEWGVEIYDWQELVEFYGQVHNLFSNIYVIVSSLLFGLVIFLVVNTMTMSIFERFSEFGTLRSIGVKKSKLVALVVIEGIILGILGIAVGMFITWGLGEMITSLEIIVSAPPGQTRGYPLNLQLKFWQSSYWDLIMISCLSIIGITALAALFPAIKAAKLKIIDAIHTV